MNLITVPGAPVSWKRAKRSFDHSYTDPLAAMHMDRIRAFARNAGYRRPMAAPFRLTTRFYKDMPPWDLRFGDWDNLTKIVKDALNRLVWEDDRWVVRIGEGGKFTDSVPRTEIEIEQIPE